MATGKPTPLGRDALLDIIRAVNTTLEPSKVAEVIVDRAAVWMAAARWSCWALVSADLSDEVTVLARRGSLGLEGEMDAPVRAVASWVMRRGEEFISADLTADPRVEAAFKMSVMAFPLSSRGHCIGALVGFNPRPLAREPRLAPSKVKAVRVLLEPAAVALDNVLLLKRAEALSVTDDLTHLYNTRYLNLVLHKETKRASRSGRPLSLLFLDLDGFKLVNDTHGHVWGSRALVEAAEVIRRSARETDVVSRFGGDEFALVLPDTGGEGAFAVGERIRERIAAHRFLAADGLNLRLTVSVGVATLPDVAASADELMQAADAAMYQVKGRGKNGIQAAAPPTDN